MKAETAIAAAAGIAVLGLGFWLWKRGIGGVAEDTAKGAVKAVGGVATGAVKGVASVAGIPDTNETECQKALREGRYWDASFLCPAGTFIRSGFDAWFGNGQTNPQGTYQPTME